MSESSPDSILDALVNPRSSGATPPAAPAPSAAPARPAATPVDRPRPLAQPAAPSPDPPAVRAPAGTGRPQFEVNRSLADRLHLRVVLFALIVLLPIAGLGYVYFESATSEGIRQGSDGYLHVDLQKMSSFEFDQRYGRLEDVPEKWRALNGKKVVLEGEMAPGNYASRQVPAFDLVWSVGACCLSGPPQVQHFVRSKVVDGRTVTFYSGPVRVRGTLRVDVTEDEGQITGVYHLDVESVEPIG